MPSAVRQGQPQPAPKKKFGTVLGLGTIFRDAHDARPPSAAPATTGRTPAFTRQSLDTARSYRDRRRRRADRSSVATVAFFDPVPTTVAPDTTTTDPATTPVAPAPPADTPSMTTHIDAAHARHTRRPPVRMDTEDGPWSVSVAETPRDARSYSLYIKTPTHNLTLTRTAMEIVELHNKLRETAPAAKLPPLPLDAAAAAGTAPPKRKSTFLNTLSRLASPTAAKHARHASARQFAAASAASSAAPTPLASPAAEAGDPFTSFAAAADGAPPPPANAALTGLAAYLTTLSNTPALRQARVWRRFVRVRTDDLESVRVERAIKRVRSDLAAHVGAKAYGARRLGAEQSAEQSADEGGHVPADGASVADEDADDAPIPLDAPPEDISEADEVAQAPHSDTADAPVTNGEAAPGTPQSPAGSLPDKVGEEAAPAAATTEDAEAATPVAEDAAPATPLASDPPSRIHRSQSADPDKSSRLSRAYAASATTLDGASSQTGDESSISTAGQQRAARKKRSMSVDPSKELAKKKSQRKVVIDDFEMMRVLGKGCAGKVLLVKHKSTTDLYALKAITKRHVLAHQELQHTLTEQAVLKRMAAESKDPFVVKLWWSFHDKENLFLVMDFHPGGDLATQLARWGRLGRDRARFYAAEIVEGVEGLHAAGVIYRDLKPENILIGADGHIVLTDFGLSKEFPRRTATATAPSTPSGTRGEFYSSVPGTPQPATPPWMKMEKNGELAAGWPGQPAGQGDTTSTFCGTAEYLAPEVIQGLPYSYEVDWWSFGTMLYEMLTGITPFWASNHSDMYIRVLQDELQFPDDRAIDQDTKSLIRGLLQRNPALRMCEPRIKRHPYFSMIDWSHVYYKRYIPPYIPPIDPSNASDTQNFDDTFLDMEPVLDDVNDNEQTDTDQEREQTDTDRTDGEESNTTPSQSRSSSIHPQQRDATVDESVDVFDGYSFKGRHSVLIDDEDEDDGSAEESDEEDADADEKDVLADLEPEALDVLDEDVVEPKTPEARPHALPDDVSEVTAEPAPEPEKAPAPAPAPAPAEAAKPATPEPVEAKPRKTKDAPAPQPRPDSVAPAPPEKDTKPRPAPPAKAPTARPVAGRLHRPRREKSGVPALDRYLSDAIDENAEATERDDDEDDDWDFVEAADGEDRNGAVGTSLFARGVVDRYRLAVFRKASTPSQRSAPRSFSGMSKESSATVSESADSPSPSRRRGRNPGLTFRKHPRQFLRAKSPPPSAYSSKSSGTGKSLTQSNSASLSAASTSSGGLLTPSPSMGSTLPITPSLKSKESAMSVGTHSFSSEQSGNGDSPVADGTTSPDTKGIPPDEPKNKKLKKYKENAEKVFSLFSSPRQPS